LLHVAKTGSKVLHRVVKQLSMIKVCYFSSKSASDIRVFEKECTSLVKAGYEVYLITPNAKDEILNGVHIIGVPYNKKGNLNRLLLLPKLLYREALKVNAEIYHFNDPASLPYGSRLKRKGKKVVYDSFEDHPTLIFEHKSLPYILKYFISKVYSLYEYYQCKKFDGLIFCYHWTKERLNKACKNNQLIFNFPILSAKVVNVIDFPYPSICYAGLITSMWEIENIIAALAQVENITFNLAGHGNQSYINALKSKEGWQKVNYLGQIKHEDVYDQVYSKSFIGLALLDYIPLCKGQVGNLSNNKLFEYMMAGLPVICTDFILWKEIVEKKSCGICVNPRNVSEIVNAIKYLRDNPEIAKQMGNIGHKLVEEKYNWKFEEKKLIDIYKSIMTSRN
jgi:glycosyltransferase involved in cell wall biosynthesis